MDANEALNLIKQEFEKSLKVGLLNLQVKWLIDRAEILQRIENRWNEVEGNGLSEGALDFYDFVQDTLFDTGE
ncbi:hypothetical protein C162_21913 [Paenibacillus sp. FSL R7-269]|uniref:hypothetical protein n=1 Tax=Paenibacillus sp. FSL R7-269 TaxID=1226755 RepID=UPI0003E27AEA|nr:hypothetical protein [Paenibacillus sp. FSL R7-269]ETT45237.1 hypothetical protein C162_21913 [Paenibacillus sp. FSL R7-269]